MSCRVAVRNVVVSYTLPDGDTVHALGPISLAIGPSEFVCIVGPSGCGKSTLLRVVAGLTLPTRGQAALNGDIVEQPSQRVGVMFQDANLMPWRTVRDNIALPLELANIPKADRYATVTEILPMLGLEDFPKAYPGELSGGMAQRVALGRVLVQRPDILLLDEPFGALDAMTREQVSADLLRIWSKTKQTVIMVTHDINEAVLLADRVIVLSPRPGRIARDIRVDLPRPRQLKDTYSDAFGVIASEVREAIQR
ncbi:MAG: ABC transporter ATP-binding protein [Chloroflexota bacterium]